MARIIEFENRRIEVPDDATDDEVRSILEGSPAPAAPAAAAAPAVTAAPIATPAAPPEPSWGDTVMSAVSTGAGVLDQGARGIAEGAANIVGLPVDLVNMAPMLANLLPGEQGVGPITPKPFGGSQMLKDTLNLGNDEIADALGLTRPQREPSNIGERAVNRVGQEVGAMAVPAAGAISRAERVGVDAARNGGVLDRMFVEPAAVDPARYLGKETAMAAGAGTGAATANELVPREAKVYGLPVGQWADVVGAIMGGGATALTDRTVRGVSNIFRAITGSPNYVDDVVKEGVVDRLAEAGGLQKVPGGPIDTTELVNAITGGERVGDTVPGIQDSMADRTRNPGIAALEYGRQTGPNAGMFTQRRADNSAAVDEALRGIEPQGNAAALRDELSIERDRRLGTAATERQQAEADASAAAERITPSTPYAEERGAAVRAGVQNAERAARETERTAWQGINGEVDPAPLAERLQNVTERLPVARQQVVADLEGALNIPAGFDGPVDMAEITALRSRLTTAQRNALRGPQPDSNRAQAIGQYIDELDNFMERAAPPETLNQLAQARTVSRDVNERFNRPNDPLARTLSEKEGRPDVPDSGVARQFLQPDSGQTSNLDRLLAETDLSSQATTTRAGLRDEVLADIQARGLANKPDALDRYLNERTALFERFPGLRDEVATAGASSRRAIGARGTEEALQRELGTGAQRGTGTVGRYLSFSDANADKAMGEVMAARDPVAAVDEILGFAGNKPEAVEGARRAYWNLMEKSSRRAGETTATLDGSQPLMPKALQRFLDDPAKAAVAERLYRDDPQHLADLRKIAGAVQGLDVRNSAKAPNTSGTAQGLLPSAESLGSRLYAFQRGQVGSKWLVTSILATIGRRALKNARGAAIDRMLDEALLNPDAAALLLRDNNPANRKALSRYAKLWFGNEASTIVNAISGDEEDETVNAITGGQK